MSERRVIFNADDFGLSPGVNTGIVEAYRSGLLTSTTMLANHAAFDHGLELLRSHPGLAVGVHLTLLWGKPIAPPGEVASLLDERGELPRRLSTLIGRWLGGRLDERAATRELSAQIARVRAAGIEPTHVDCHKHVHCLPPVFRAVVAACRDHGISRVRVAYERPLFARTARPAGLARALAARAFTWRQRRRLARAGLRTPDAFVGIQFENALDESALVAICGRLPLGVTEVMCHPGYPDAEAESWSRRPPRRQQELEALASPGARAALAAAGATRISYRDL